MRLQQGASVGDCVNLYPQYAAELEPMLMAAAQMRTLATQQLAAAQRLAGKRALRQALAAQRAQAQPAPGPGWLAWLKGPVAIPLAALLLFAVLAAGAVAASQPGDLAYGARVAIEQATVWRFGDAGRRVTAELAVAERRLNDLQRAWQQTARVDSTALQALIQGDEAAAETAVRLTTAERNAVAARVAVHAANLATLGATVPDEAVRQRLAVAAARLQRMAERLQTRLEQGNGSANGGTMATPSVRGDATPHRPTTAAPDATPHTALPSPTIAATPVPSLTPPLETPTPAATVPHPSSSGAGTRTGRPTVAETTEPGRPAPGTSPLTSTPRAGQTPTSRQPTSAGPSTAESPRGGATSVAPPQSPAPPSQPQPTRRGRP
ncbi:MAG: hypothetical protein N2439_02775 [Anaerolineae bacterium]|nr:hypothetical protein [Anaerolineae bacterium]